MKIKRRKDIENLEYFDCIPLFLQKVLAHRGIRSMEQLDKRLQALVSYESLMDIDKAVIRLTEALQKAQRILVVGDFDADGATSTALAVSALRTFGAPFVEYLVPNRFEYGYGLSPEIVKVAAQQNPELIITVDNGISSIEGVATANSLGIDVIVTDHHLAGEALPDACAIVNPNQPGDPFESKAIAGVGVIFYVMMALRRHLVNIQWFSERKISEPNMSQFLDLVALGTVADVVSLDQNNRILINQGLTRIRHGKVRPGIKALIKIAGRQIETLRETDLGYAVAPRLNAAGRLDDMSLGISCLLSETDHEAIQKAEALDALNQERRSIEMEMKEQAYKFIEQLQEKIPSGGSLPLGLCLFDENWHQGVIGILAGRLKEKFHRPAIIFAKVSEEEMKGSARSVNGMNIRDVLADIDKNHPGLIKKFGGHAMAAGLSITPQAFEDFKSIFTTEVSKHIDHSQCEGVIQSDGELEPGYLSLEGAKLINEYGPWGQHFPEPCFDGIFEIIEQRIVGKNHLKLTLVHPENKKTFDAIAFNVDLQEWPNHRVSHIHIAYKLDINTYQGRSKVQLMVEALHPQRIEQNVLEIHENFAEYSW